MYRLEIKISIPGEANFQVVWKDVESIEAGEEHGKWVQQEYINTGKTVEYKILPETVQYKFQVYLDRDPWREQSNWFDDMQDAANYGWMRMRKLNEEGYAGLHGVLVDNTDHIRCNLLGRNTTSPIPYVNPNELEVLRKAADSIMQEKMGRPTTAWKENGCSILDIEINPPRGVFRNQLDNGVRVIDFKGDAQFFSNVNDSSFQELFNALQTAGRSVNTILKTTTRQ